MAHRLLRGLRGAFVKNFVVQQTQSNPNNHFLKVFIRNYVPEMRKSAFEGNILRLIRNEIQYELDHSPSTEPLQEFNSFKVDRRTGEQWICLSRRFGDNEDIKVEVTMFDGSIPVKKTDDSLEVKMHVTLIVGVFKEASDETLEFICSAWPDGIEILNVFTRGHERVKDQAYMGPKFKELDDELQDSLYDYLEARGIDEKLAGFVHSYMRYKDKSEYLHWMENIKSFIQKKPKHNGVVTM